MRLRSHTTVTIDRAVSTHIRSFQVPCRPIPGDHFSLIVEQPAQLDVDTPASFIFTLPAHLLWTASLSEGKEQFNRVAIDHREEARFRQQPAAPVLMHLQQSLQTRSFRQSSS